ncbi:uncharacterized protein [Tursiops truncatus]|uniref:uncharacterized protein n=1 Tax=Tursiops truncatus TaxID=9739 RepID=UPI003CCF9DE2
MDMILFEMNQSDSKEDDSSEENSQDSSEDSSEFEDEDDSTSSEGEVTIDTIKLPHSEDGKGKIEASPTTKPQAEPWLRLERPPLSPRLSLLSPVVRAPDAHKRFADEANRSGDAGRSPVDAVRLAGEYRLRSPMTASCGFRRKWPQGRSSTTATTPGRTVFPRRPRSSTGRPIGRGVAVPCEGGREGRGRTSSASSLRHSGPTHCGEKHIWEKGRTGSREKAGGNLAASTSVGDLEPLSGDTLKAEVRPPGHTDDSGDGYPLLTTCFNVGVSRARDTRECRSNRPDPPLKNFYGAQRRPHTTNVCPSKSRESSKRPCAGDRDPSAPSNMLIGPSSSLSARARCVHHVRSGTLVDRSGRK